MYTITVAQLKNAFDEYLDKVASGETLIIIKDGKEICEICPRTKSKLDALEALTGIARGVDAAVAHEERLLKD